MTDIDYEKELASEMLKHANFSFLKGEKREAFLAGGAQATGALLRLLRDRGVFQRIVKHNSPLDASPIYYSWDDNRGSKW